MIDCIALTEVALFQIEKLLLAEPAKVRVDYGKEKLKARYKNYQFKMTKNEVKIAGETRSVPHQWDLLFEKKKKFLSFTAHSSHCFLTTPSSNGFLQYCHRRL